MVAKVRRYGWQTTSVEGQDGGDPSFSYTTGFWLTVDQPEVIVFDFPPQLSHDVFGQMMKRARGGSRFPTGTPLDGVLSDERLYLFPVKREARVKYLRSSDWFYKGGEFPVVQLAWPDAGGKFPWEEGSTKRSGASSPTFLNEVGSRSFTVRPDAPNRGTALCAA